MKARRRLPSRALAFALAGTTASATLALGCHHNDADTKLAVGSDEEDAKVARNGAKNRGGGGAPSVDAHLIASLSDRAIGPFLAQRDSHGLVMYIGTVEDGTRSLVGIALDAEGNAHGDSLRLLPMKEDASKLVVKATGGSGAGFVAAWSAITERGESVYLVGVSDDAKLRGVATELSHTNDHVVWLDVIPTAAGAVCLWAEETRTGGASLFAAAIDPDGKLHGSPSRVVRSVKAWQSVATEDGVGLALVTRVDTRGIGAETGGSLSFLRLDASAHASAAPVIITPKAEVGADVDVVRVHDTDSYIFAWTDMSEADPYVAVASVTTAGKVTAPVRAVSAPTGGSSLVALEAGSSGVALAWDEPLKRGRTLRRVHVERLDAALNQPQTSDQDVAFDFAGRSDVEMTADGEGFALLASARSCSRPAESMGIHCTDDTVPTFMRLDKVLAPREVEPIRMEADRVPAALAWNLTCTGDRCNVLTVDSGSPAKVRTVDFTPKESAFQAPIAPTPPSGAPRVSALTTLASGAGFTQIAATALGQLDKPRMIAPGTVIAPNAAVPGPAGVSAATLNAANAANAAIATPAREATTLVAMIAANTDANGNAGEGTLTVLPVDDKGNGYPGAPPVTIRAVLAHGLAIAAAPRAEDGAAVAWVARDAGDLQVHVSRVDRKGRRTNDVMLTSAKGDASDVAIAWVGGGWIVAWVDSRDGNGEVYATKVGLDLARIAREERITTAQGDASDLTILAPTAIPAAMAPTKPVVPGSPNGQMAAAATPAAPTADVDAWLAWADPREDEVNGTSDVYYARIHARDAKKDGTEVRALASAAHSHSPVLASAGDSGGALLAWIEDAPLGSDPTVPGAHGAMLLTIDARGRAQRDPDRLQPAGEGFATAITLEPSETGDVRAVLARSVREDLTLDVLEIGSSRASMHATPLLTLDAPGSFDVTMNLSSGALYFDDDGAPTHLASAEGQTLGTAGDRRVRRAAIRWTR